MQPITYSLVINLCVLAACTALAFMFNQPLLVVVALVLQTHALDRFRDEDPDKSDEEEESCIGFTANVK